MSIVSVDRAIPTSAARPPSYRASSEDVPPEDRARIWREMTETVSEFFLERIRPEGLSWSVEGVTIGSMPFGTSSHKGADITIVRSPERIARDGIDAVRVMQCIEGASWWVTDVGEFAQGVGDIVISDFTRPDIVHTRALSSRVLILPRASLGVPEPALDHLHGLALRPGGATHALLEAHLAALWDRRNEITLEEADHIAVGTVALFTALLVGPAASRWTAGLRSEAVTARIMRFIRENLGNAALGPEMLGRRFGVSRAALYRIFEPFGGVASYVRNQRLKRAFHILGAAGPRPALGKLSAELGFTSLDVFRSAFRRKHGFGPTEARDHLLAGSVSFAGPDPDLPHMTIPGWVRAVRGA